MRNTMLAQGHPVPDDAVPDPQDRVYDVDWVNADVDPRVLAQNLRRVGAGRMFMHGAPGTGKTAYARWLADTVKKPLHVKRASDILSAFVGDNERNIASAFRIAKRDGAVLLIDEIDTFLLDRRAAQRHWEVSLVNEMLTQMECHDGRQCAVLGIGEPEAELEQYMGRLNGLVPGDFATVARRSRLSAIAAPRAFVTALAEECALKGDQRTIGFALP